MLGTGRAALPAESAFARAEFDAGEAVSPDDHYALRTTVDAGFAARALAGKCIRVPQPGQFNGFGFSTTAPQNPVTATGVQ